MEIALIPETDPTLYKRTIQFDFSKPPINPHDLSEAMFNLMLLNNGIGLAAPQCGINLNVFVMGDLEKRWYIFNPTIQYSTDGTVNGTEGCLSFPGLELRVGRPESVGIEYQDADGNLHYEEFSGLLARCVQHEIDHLNGIVFLERVSKLQADRAKKKRFKRSM